MANTQSQRFTAYAGEDISIVLTGEDNTNPTAYTMRFTVKTYPANATEALEVTSITVGGAGPYTLTIPITRAQSGTTLGVGEWFWDVFRTDSGSSKRLAGGTLALLQPVRDTA